MSLRYLTLAVVLACSAAAAPGNLAAQDAAVQNSSVRNSSIQNAAQQALEALTPGSTAAPAAGNSAAIAKGAAPAEASASTASSAAASATEKAVGKKPGKKSTTAKKTKPADRAVAPTDDADQNNAGAHLEQTPDTKSLPTFSKAAAGAQQELGAMARQMAGGVFFVGTPDGHIGTAWCISKQNRLLITNAHVADFFHNSGGKVNAVQNGTATFYKVAQVWYHPGVRRFVKGARSLSVRSSDPEEGDIDINSPDLAIMQLSDEGPELTTEFAPANRDELISLFAQPVAIMGFPLHDNEQGLPGPGQTAAATFHDGVVSRVTDFQLSTGAPIGEQQFIQYTMPTWGGFSGSPIFLASGHVAAVHNSANKAENKKFGEVRSIPHGIRVDSVLEMLVHHGLDSQVAFAIDKNSLGIDRWVQPDARTEKARADLAKATELVDEALKLLGEDKYLPAAEKCSESIQTVPTYAPAYSWRAATFYIAWLNRGELSQTEALALLNGAIDDAILANKLAPDNEELLQICRIQNALTLQTDDTSHSQKSLAIVGALLSAPDDLEVGQRADAYQVRGNTYNMLGQTRDALLDYNQSCELDAENPARFDARARFLEAVNRPTDANKDRAWAAHLRGEEFQVWWEGQWYAAEIIRIHENQYHVHYTGYSTEWDEWVPFTRVRFKK